MFHGCSSHEIISLTGRSASEQVHSRLIKRHFCTCRLGIKSLLFLSKDRKSRIYFAYLTSPKTAASMTSTRPSRVPGMLHPAYEPPTVVPSTKLSRCSLASYDHALHKLLPKSRKSPSTSVHLEISPAPPQFVLSTLLVRLSYTSMQ